MNSHKPFVYSIVASLFLLYATFCAAQTAVLAPLPRQCFVDSLSAGKPLASGLIYTCSAGTSCPGTPLATFTDSSGTIQNQNPLQLDGAGCASIWLSTGLAYKFVAQNSLGVQEWSADNVAGLASSLTTSIASTTAIAFSATPTFSTLAQNQLFTMTLTGNVTSSSLVMSGITPPGLVSFEITQDGTGGRTFAWPVTMFGAASIATCANCTTVEHFMWDGSTALLISATYNTGGQMFPAVRADTLTGNFFTTGGQTEGAIVGYSFWGSHTSPSTTASEVLVTHKLTGTMPAVGTLAGLTAETDIVGSVTPSSAAVIADEGYTAIRSNGGTFPDVRGYTASVNLDLAGSTTNITNASSLFGSPCINSTGGTATITNCYSVRGGQPTAGSVRNYAMFSEGNFLLSNNVNLDMIDGSATPQHIFTPTPSNDLVIHGLADTHGVLFETAAGATEVQINSTGMKIATGVNGDGSGFKHKRVAACTTAAGANGTCSSTVTWGTAFADANYTGTCTLEGNTGAFILGVAASKTGTSMGVVLMNSPGQTLAISGTTIDCIAVHD